MGSNSRLCSFLLGKELVCIGCINTDSANKKAELIAIC